MTAQGKRLDRDITRYLEFVSLLDDAPTFSPAEDPLTWLYSDGPDKFGRSYYLDIDGNRVYLDDEDQD